MFTQLGSWKASLWLNPIPLSLAVNHWAPPAYCVFSFDVSPCCAYSKNTSRKPRLQANVNVQSDSKLFNKGIFMSLCLRPGWNVQAVKIPSKISELLYSNSSQGKVYPHQTNSLQNYLTMIYLHWWILDRLLLAVSAASVCSSFILTLLASAKFSDFLLLLAPPTPPPVVGILIPFLSRISMTWNYKGIIIQEINIWF